MNPSNPYPCNRLTRRALLHRAGGGFLGVALGAMWSQAGEIPIASLPYASGPHFTPKAKSVIFLFMCGGVSHIDTFDPKDNKWAGKLIDVVGFGDNLDQLAGVLVVLGIEGVDVADAAAHEKEDDGLGLRLTDYGLGNFLRLGQDTAERQPEKSATDLVDETTARIAAAGIQIRVTEHK